MREKFRREDVIELNEKNVVSIYQRCLADENTDKYDLSRFTFIDNPNIPKISFDLKKLGQYKEKINYMYGQLYYIHRRKEDNLDFKLSIGAMNYKGAAWTKNQNILFALYYMGNAASIIHQFTRDGKSIVSDITNTIPTLSPDDANFEAWSKIFVKD